MPRAVCNAKIGETAQWRTAPIFNIDDRPLRSAGSGVLSEAARRSREAITQGLRGHPLLDHAATQAHLAAVKNQRLPGCDRPLRRVELDLEFRGAALRDPAGRVGLAVARFPAARKLRIRRRAAYPGEIPRGQALAQEQRMIVPLHHDQLVPAEILSGHVPRLAFGAL